jgi:hypothetical protein
MPTPSEIPIMFRPAAIVLFMAGAALAQSPPAKKDPHPEAQQDVIDRLERIQSMYREAGTARNLPRRTEALEVIRAEAKAFRDDLTKRLTKDGLTDWVGTVSAVTTDNIEFDVSPGLILKIGRPGMDGLTRLAVQSLAKGDPVTISLAPALIAEVQGEGTRFVAIVGGKHLTLTKGRPK